MRLKIEVLTILLVLAFQASGQKFQGGLTAGLNAARIDNDTDELYGKLGLNAGAFVARQTSIDLLYWQLELKYTSRGKYDIQRDLAGNIMGLDLIDLRYIEMPVSLHYFINERIQAELGFAPDVLIREYYADENGAIPLDNANDLRRFGITAFAGVNFFVRPELAFGIRFNYSVVPFYKFDAYAVRYRNSGWFHDVLSINARYYISR
ncbi:MAG: outer membrane beta-barrel protein [Bacteroidales bacterium]|nr:outer membrane beta-barrel protein [Bacteroidales bacterium]MDT8431148.1 outer membrane beta-barrel protein [Bacteroidales bacterium]